jgi:hypothetical protein
MNTKQKNEWVFIPVNDIIRVPSAKNLPRNAELVISYYFELDRLMNSDKVSNTYYLSSN